MKLRSPHFRDLQDFIINRMRLSHIYQPVMLRTLLQNGGTASTRDIAKAFLSEDISQIEYYEEITKRMPGRVLASHGIVERDGNEFKLAGQYSSLTEEERADLISECDAALRAYLEKRGLAPWQHRKKSKGYIPGSLRYDIIQRAKGRCEACGISVKEAALEVDHIVPRNKGGTDDRTNLQALCYVCNAQKRDRDDTDFAAVQASYGDRSEGCPFCDREPMAGYPSHPLAAVLEDKYPVTQGHLLITPRRHVADYFELHHPERMAIDQLLHDAREQLMKADRSIEGFNVGINAGEAAGQTVRHVHVHLIPRRKGDMADPRGGVRGVIPEKQKY